MDKKINETSGATEATGPSVRAQHTGDGGARRFSAQRKLSAVQRLFRGESLPPLTLRFVTKARISFSEPLVWSGTGATLMSRMRHK